MAGSRETGSETGGSAGCSAEVADVSARELAATRIFDAQRELVFKAWTTPEHLAQWWGPRGFTNTFQEFDLRPGGVWRFIMHGPHGADYPNQSVFVEIVPPERIVLQHVSEPRFQVTAIFEDLGGKTRLTFRHPVSYRANAILRARTHRVRLSLCPSALPMLQ